MIKQRTLTVFRRLDGFFAIVEGRVQGKQLGIDRNLEKAICVAVREGVLISRKDRCQVGIEVELPNGKFRLEQLVNPPVKMKQNSSLSKTRT